MSTILVVEDDVIISKIITMRLKSWQHQVVMAEDGQTAVSQAFTHHPDLILMDMRLPILDGWQATLQIKSHPVTTDIPVIAMTAVNTIDEIQACYNVGCVAILTKPIQADELHSLLKKYLPK